MPELSALPYLSLAIVLCLNLLAVVWLFGRHLFLKRQERLRLSIRTTLVKFFYPAQELSSLTKELSLLLNRHPLLFAQEYRRLLAVANLPEDQHKTLAFIFDKSRLKAMALRWLKAYNPFKRCQAAFVLSIFPKEMALCPLIQALEKEQNLTVKLFLSFALAELRESAALPTIIDSLKGMPLRYQRAVQSILTDFAEGLAEFVPVLSMRSEKEIKLLLVKLAERLPTVLLTNYLEKILKTESDLDLIHGAFRVLVKIKPTGLDLKAYLKHSDFLIRNLAAEGLGRLVQLNSLAILFEVIDDPVIRKSAALALSSLVRAQPHFLRIIMYRFLNENRHQAQTVLADVLAGFVEYLVVKTLKQEKELALEVLFKLVAFGKTKSIISFLNRNADPEIEKTILAIFTQILKSKPELAGELLNYLDERITKRLNLKPSAPTFTKSKRQEKTSKPLLVLFFIIGAFATPIICLAEAARHYPLASLSNLIQALNTFNKIFAGYALLLSLSYLLLFVFSFRGVKRQARSSSILTATMLFKENVLPSISIISPAYNEESSIVDSVKALLNLNYPDYEIIVVNDGSTDHTLFKLIQVFELERSDIFIHNYLNTQEIRAIYTSRRFTQLMVIDKQNGGKADSLNAGLNACRKEYYSGLDADSLLERDSLLHLTSLFLFKKEEVIAAGGNILPVNGCEIRLGSLECLRIPPTWLGRLQTIEYLRAFMAGRVGWAELRLLLIISGAFGVFKQRAVINAGGYLTHRERFGKDTVGEDMELVVRLYRGGREEKRPFSSVYGFNANCWTEIPEKLNIFINQRDRWQRGLLDILTFHRKLFFNPAYGRLGLIGFPYFLVFEVLGPWLEVEGFAVFIGSLLGGLVSLPLALLVLSATVGLGLFISVLAVGLAEYHKPYFPWRDKFKLFLASVAENFGIRQCFNLIRLRALLRLLGKTEGWGKMVHRGFKPSQKK